MTAFIIIAFLIFRLCLALWSNRRITDPFGFWLPLLFGVTGVILATLMRIALNQKEMGEMEVRAVREIISTIKNVHNNN